MVRLAALLLTALLIPACGASAPQPTPVPDPRVAEVKEVRERIVASLRDPESAKFRNVTRVPGWPAAGEVPGMYAYCGEMNSKNAFGGYVGFQKFAILGPGTSKVEIADPSDPAARSARIADDTRFGLEQTFFQNFQEELLVGAQRQVCGR